MNVYAKKFVDSINKLKKKGLLKPKIKKFYNYLIVDAKSLYNLLQRFFTDEPCDLKQGKLLSKTWSILNQL